MHSKLAGWQDTIIALATPPGVGALGVLRISGTRAIEISGRLFSKDISGQPGHTLHIGLLRHGGEVLDQVVLSLFRAPNSYTGEDVVEFSCHGSPFIHQRVMDACMAEGARLARPGEFTQRAFLNGKLDLAQAEAVADLIASNTRASHRTALNNIRGGFSAALKELRGQLLQFSALIELELDFSQEDVEFADRSRLSELVSGAVSMTRSLLDSFRLGNVIRNGVSTAIIGKPNAGKSTLLNALLNEDRAIVSDIPGTTRDTIEEVLNIDGILFRLIDTAGIRSHSADMIEHAGMEKSMQKMKQADVVIYLFDVNHESPAEISARAAGMEQEGIRFILVGNKVDQADMNAVRDRFSALQPVLVSARDHVHLEVLKERMVDLVLDGKLETEDAVVTNARHYHALKQVDASLRDISQALVSGLPGDLLALDIRRCLQYLGEITGEITSEDMLDYIFSRFCIGK